MLDVNMNPYEEIDKALETISSATDRWDYEEKQGPLWQAAIKYPKEMMEYYYKYPDHQISISWCLANVKNIILKEFFIEQSKNKNEYIRWYSFIYLRKHKSKSIIPIFVKGLKDRSSLVKSEAVQAVKNIKDERVEKALKHLIGLKSFKKHSPGTYNEAIEIIQKYENI